MTSDSITISTVALTRTGDTKGKGGLLNTLSASRTRFTDLPLPARLLLAVPRTRGVERTVPIAERYVLDTLGRIIDGGPDRQGTIEAVNLLAEILLGQANRPAAGSEAHEPEWLSATEDMVLCILCKIQGGQSDEAVSLARHWLDAPSVAAFSKAAAALCSADCFRRGGTQVFTPSWPGMPDHGGTAIQESVFKTCELSLGEALLLNALRLRKRTLSHVGLGARVVPLLCQHVALPDLQSVVDALLVEFIRYSSRAPLIRCLCNREISAEEAVYLGSLSAFVAGDRTGAERLLSEFLPADSVERLLAQQEGFASILEQIGTPIPTRQWHIHALREREVLHQPCEHVNETPMIH